MSTDPKFRCSQCKKYKLPDEYGTRQSGGSHGQKGSRLSVCLSCGAVNSANRKRRRIESNRDTTQPLTSPSQFVQALAEHASASKIDSSWHISLDEMTLTDKGIADHIASLAWKAMGYRFR
jgi:hypothetical protein